MDNLMKFLKLIRCSNTPNTRCFRGTIINLREGREGVSLNLISMRRPPYLAAKLDVRPH